MSFTSQLGTFGSQLINFELGSVPSGGGGGVVHTENLNQTLTLTQTASQIVLVVKSLIQTLTFTQEVSVPVNELEAQTLSLTQQTLQTRVLPLSIIQTLHLVQELSKNSVTNLTVTQSISFHNGYSAQLPLLGQKLNGTQLPAIFYGPPAIGIVTNHKTRFVILQAGSQAIVLRTPQLGDSESTENSIELKKTKTGITYTYVKRSKLRKLKYTFYLGRQKSLELESFLTSHCNEILTMTNWKGEIWIGNVTTNPFEFTTSQRYLKQSERVDITIEFTGIRIVAGTPSLCGAT